MTNGGKSFSTCHFQAPEPVRAASPERQPSSTTRRLPGFASSRPLRSARRLRRPPVPAKQARNRSLVQILIGAVCAGGSRLSRVRSEFEQLDAGAGVKRLVLQAVDPELLEAVVGPRLVPAWVKPLRAQYARFKEAYPADWVDVEKVWREQRERWRSKVVPHREQPPSRAVPPPAPAPASGAADKAQQQSGYDR